LDGSLPKIYLAVRPFNQVVSEEKIFLNFIPPFFYFSLAAILAGSRDHRTHFWKGAIQGPFHQSLVAIGPVVSCGGIISFGHLEIWPLPPLGN
jgi:hypothetical protein